MSRMNLLMAVAVAAGVVGCAQCDTCDDFPAPCVGANCGQGLMPGGIPGALDSQMGAPVMGAASYSTPPVDDSAGPGPVAPPAAALPMTPPAPPVDPSSPPVPMESAPSPR